MAVDMLTVIMTFIYTIGHWIAEKVVLIIQAISGVIIPSTIVDAIGLLIVLTIFLSLADIAKKIVWTIVVLGWILIIIRIVLLMIGT